MHIIVITQRAETLTEFIDGLSFVQGVVLEVVRTSGEAVEKIKGKNNRLVVIDDVPPSVDALAFIPELLMKDASTQTAVISPLSSRDFHETFEGLGVLEALPEQPGRMEAEHLLKTMASTASG